MAAPDPTTYLALRALAETYAKGVDKRDEAAFLAAFHPDAWLHVHNPSESTELMSEMRGHAELAKVPQFITVYPKTYHFLGQSSYDVQGDEATGETYCIAHHLSPTRHGGDDYVMHIRYEDRYRTGDDGAWRIAERAVRIDWTERRLANPQGR